MNKLHSLPSNKYTVKAKLNRSFFRLIAIMTLPLISAHTASEKSIQINESMKVHKSNSQINWSQQTVKLSREKLGSALRFLGKEGGIFGDWNTLTKNLPFGGKVRGSTSWLG